MAAECLFVMVLASLCSALGTNAADKASDARDKSAVQYAAHTAGGSGGRGAPLAVRKAQGRKVLRLYLDSKLGLVTNIGNGSANA